MNDPKGHRNNGDEATPSAVSSEDLDDAESTVQLRTLKLEKELWPAEPAADADQDGGVDPYNSGRFIRRKNP